MNIQFKEEFKKLNKDKLKFIINGCAGRDILETDITQTNQKSHYNDLYYMSYIDDEKYGYWTIQWGYKKLTNGVFTTGGNFEFSIKITPFKVEFYNANSFNPFVNTHKQKQLEDYIPIYINQVCPHYIETIREETEKFIKMINFNNEQKF